MWSLTASSLCVGSTFVIKRLRRRHGSLIFCQMVDPRDLNTPNHPATFGSQREQYRSCFFTPFRFFSAVAAIWEDLTRHIERRETCKTCAQTLRPATRSDPRVRFCICTLTPGHTLLLSPTPPKIWPLSSSMFSPDVLGELCRLAGLPSTFHHTNTDDVQVDVLQRLEPLLLRHSGRRCSPEPG